MTETKPKAVAKRSDVTEDRLQKAKTSAQSLNKATEALNDRLREAEELLQEMNVGVEVAIPLYEPLDFDRDGQIAFAKSGNEWRLLWLPEEGTAGQFKAMEVPLLSAPRDVRVAAALRIGDLVADLLEKSESHLSEIHSAIDALDQVCQTLGGRRR